MFSILHNTIYLLLCCITILRTTEILNTYLYLGRTSLMYAAGNGHAETVRILLENKADVHHRDKLS